MTLLRVVGQVVGVMLIGALCCAVVAGPSLGAAWLALFLLGDGSVLAFVVATMATILWLSVLVRVLFGPGGLS